jgi:hypothetical protein
MTRAYKTTKGKIWSNKVISSCQEINPGASILSDLYTSFPYGASAFSAQLMSFGYFLTLAI